MFMIISEILWLKNKLINLSITFRFNLYNKFNMHIKCIFTYNRIFYDNFKKTKKYKKYIIIS